MADLPERPATPLFALELDAAIAVRGVSCGELSRRLRRLGTPISRSALESWRTGQRHPERGSSLNAIDNLEELLELPRGHLIERLGPSRRFGPDHGARFEDLVGRGGPMARMRASMGLDVREVDALSATHLVEIRRDAREWSLTQQWHWRARVTRARRVSAMLHLDNPSDISPRLVSVEGANVGRIEWDRPSGFGLWELLLDDPLELGRTTRTEHRLDITESVDLPNYWVVVERRVASAALCIRWEGRPPRHLELRIESPEDERVHVLPVSGGSTHAMLTQFGPGAFGFEWVW